MPSAATTPDTRSRRGDRPHDLLGGLGVGHDRGLHGLVVGAVVEALVTQIALANWNVELDTGRLAEVGGLAAEYGILDAEPDMDELVWSGG